MQLCEGVVKEENFPHTRKPLHWWRRGWWWGSFRATEESTVTGVQRAKQRDSRTEDPCDQHSPAERLVCSPAGVGGGWELRHGLRRADPRERTGIGCVNTEGDQCATASQERVREKV